MVVLQEAILNDSSSKGVYELAELSDLAGPSHLSSCLHGSLSMPGGDRGSKSELHVFVLALWLTIQKTICLLLIH